MTPWQNVAVSQAVTNEAFRQAEEDSSQMMTQLTGGLGGLGGGFPF